MQTEWRDRFILTPDVTLPGERAALYRAAARGAFVRVIRGAYVEAAYWAGLDYEERHLTRMRAARLLDPGLVFSHLTAALAHGLPVVGGDLAIPHALGEPSGGTRSRTWLRRHAIARPRTIELIDGIPVTSLVDTLVDVAAGYPPEVAVPALDHAIAHAGVGREEVLAGLSLVPPSGGAVRGTWSARFADPRSGSAGESLSRVGIHRLGLPHPELQVRIEDALGFIGVVDFYWPDHRLIGEFDGLGKYLREALTGGRTAGEVVVEEKHREDRLRATGRGVARWGWQDARNTGSLRRILADAGLRAV